MGSNGDDISNSRQSLAQHSSIYNLTLDEVQNQLGDLGKPLSSMNLDELLKNVWSAEANQLSGLETEGTPLANQSALQYQASLSLSSDLSKKTIDEVWKDIQQSKNNGELRSWERQATLGEMTLEDFLVKAGIVAEASLGKKDSGGFERLVVPPQYPQQQGQWMQYQHQQYQHPRQSMVGVYKPGADPPIPHSLQLGASPVMEVPFPENQVPVTSTLMGTLSDTQPTIRKRYMPEDVIEKSVERRQKRMIKNRESAARSRARKQAYTNELENKVSRLEEENIRLRKLKKLERLLHSAPAPKYQLRRISSALF